tara:strand:- start:3525 stop:3737 length:213 start_codon:yes stop_codon:yes gene_type:complete
MSDVVNKFANDFYTSFEETTDPTSHEEWLLREYSKLMHREIKVKQLENKLNKSVYSKHVNNTVSNNDSNN